MFQRLICALVAIVVLAPAANAQGHRTWPAAAGHDCDFLPRTYFLPFSLAVVDLNNNGRYRPLATLNDGFELGLIDSQQRRLIASTFGRPTESVITSSQRCSGPYFCGPANSCITMLVTTSPDGPAVPVTQCCGWGFYPWIQTCGEQQPRRGCRSALDPFAHCDRKLPADPPKSGGGGDIAVETLLILVALKFIVSKLQTINSRRTKSR
jgi:hypothetical protein